MTSPQAHYFWSSLPVYLLVSLIGLLLGILLGWVLWRNCRAAVAKINDENQKLQKDYKALSRVVHENSI